MIFYSKSAGGFFSDEIHGKNIPSDAVQIADEVHFQLMEAQSKGKTIIGDVHGYPVAVFVEEETPSMEELAESIRRERDKLLSGSDWVMMPDVKMSEDLKSKWIEYRQALREVTQQPGFPVKVVFPTKP